MKASWNKYFLNNQMQKEKQLFMWHNVADFHVLKNSFYSVDANCKKKKKSAHYFHFFCFCWELTENNLMILKKKKIKKIIFSIDTSMEIFFAHRHACMPKKVKKEGSIFFSFGF